MKFKNINGEGVVATLNKDGMNQIQEEIGMIYPAHSGRTIKVLCGNDKLMDRYNIDLEFNNFRMNMQSLEKEGKTVVCMAID